MSLALFAFLGAIGVVAVYAFVPDFSRDMRIFGAAIAVTSVTCKYNNNNWALYL